MNLCRRGRLDRVLVTVGSWIFVVVVARQRCAATISEGSHPLRFGVGIIFYHRLFHEFLFFPHKQRIGIVDGLFFSNLHVTTSGVEYVNDEWKVY